ncbi:MAG: nucleoside deaminase [Deltaproteobacteria bacterium]|nr:nucleoside deaminase [Deltaproteobacteria bacterium]
MREHEHYMEEALKEALSAASMGEVPIGAVAVMEGEVIARVHNMRETTQDPLGHAEILLLKKLIGSQVSWRLEGVTVYVTCEPCLMCMGAFIHARIPRVVFGCMEPKMGACGSLYDFSTDKRLHHKIEIFPHVLHEKCAGVLKGFFKNLRKGVEVEGISKNL